MKEAKNSKLRYTETSKKASIGPGCMMSAGSPTVVPAGIVTNVATYCISDLNKNNDEFDLQTLLEFYKDIHWRKKDIFLKNVSITKCGESLCGAACTDQITRNHHVSTELNFWKMMNMIKFSF